MVDNIHSPLAMKRILIILLAMLGLAMVSPAHAGGLGKQLKKEWKKQTKQLKAEGWNVYGHTVSLEKAMESHYLKLEEIGLQARVVEGRGKAADIDAAVGKSQTNAKKHYTVTQGSDIISLNETNVKNEQGENVTTSITFNSTTQSRSEHRIKNFTPTVVLYRKSNDKTFEAMSLYVVEEGPQNLE